MYITQNHQVPDITTSAPEALPFPNAFFTTIYCVVLDSKWNDIGATRWGISSVVRGVDKFKHENRKMTLYKWISHLPNELHQ